MLNACLHYELLGMATNQLYASRLIFLNSPFFFPGSIKSSLCCPHHKVSDDHPTTKFLLEIAIQVPQTETMLHPIQNFIKYNHKSQKNHSSK